MNRLVKSRLRFRTTRFCLCDFRLPLVAMATPVVAATKEQAVNEDLNDKVG
jgi:hypothetical protein